MQTTDLIMFGGGRPGRGRATEFGPVPIPRGEKVQLLPLRSKGEDVQDKFSDPIPAPSDKPSTVVSVSAALCSEDAAGEIAKNGRSEPSIAGSFSSSPVPSSEAQGTTAIFKDNAGTGSTSITTNSSFNPGNDVNSIVADDLKAQFGQNLEFACGAALRKNVLGPVLGEYDSMEEDVLTEAPRLLSLISKGHLLFMQNGNRVGCGSIERICNTDGAGIGLWYDAGDKYLSYVDESWSEWWVRRCHGFDPGCEMIKLCSLDGATLGVAYMERNLVDQNQMGEEHLGRITLIRGIRVVPHLNREVQQRREPLGGTPEIFEYRGVATLLLCHIIFTSIRYGAEAIAVHPPKNEQAENFYDFFMGPPTLIEDDDGRRYYRVDGDNKWKILQNCFRYQLNLFIRHREEEVIRVEEEEKAAIMATEKEAERVLLEAKQAFLSELAGIRQAEDDARNEEEESERLASKLGANGENDEETDEEEEATSPRNDFDSINLREADNTQSAGEQRTEIVGLNMVEGHQSFSAKRPLGNETKKRKLIE